MDPLVIKYKYPRCPLCGVDLEKIQSNIGSPGLSVPWAHFDLHEREMAQRMTALVSNMGNIDVKQAAANQTAAFELASLVRMAKEMRADADTVLEARSLWFAKGRG